MNIYIDMCACVRACVHACVRACVRACVCVCVCVCVCYKLYVHLKIWKSVYCLGSNLSHIVDSMILIACFIQIGSLVN